MCAGGRSPGSATKRQLSQMQLASKCQLAGWDISRDIIARMELGIRRIEDHELAKLAQMLDTPIEEFYPREIRSRLPRPH